MNKSLYIPFEGARLIAAEYDGQVYVAMRPIVQGMGLDWATQSKKLQKNITKYGCRHMTTPTTSGEQEMLYIPLKKLNGWLFGINPAKVRADLRETVERYQEECFLVLHDYWNRGEAVRAKVQVELDAWRNQETASFARGSHAGRDLNLRKQEKHYIAAKIRQCEVNLLQPDLFQAA
ncbi:phage antirepressor N-terminal domain-containing protein [Neisseria elongata]|uniref:phage antirepressor N-terminal domain-containing protein n=1 Tax=Neisseria elongata TaxID=495 RepID=UPI0024B12D15|nr:phage antirepressor N-terminal domain-containing protein [Neisseria elongata]